ncbi:MAG: preprotein translocase subunit YajC [Oscillospiraceae bacterium]
MNFNPITLADSAATNTAANGPQSMILMIVWLAVIFGAMYFIMIRPQRKKQKEEKKMRDNLQVGDEKLLLSAEFTAGLFLLKRKPS